MLIVHDNTQLDYGYRPAISGLGPIGNGSHRGFFVHTVLAVGPEAAVSACSDYCIKKPGCATPLLARPMAAKRAADSDESGTGKRGVDASGGAGGFASGGGGVDPCGRPVCRYVCLFAALSPDGNLLPGASSPEFDGRSVRSSRPSPNWIICSTGRHPGQPRRTAASKCPVSMNGGQEPHRCSSVGDACTCSPLGEHGRWKCFPADLGGAGVGAGATWQGGSPARVCAQPET